MSRETGGNTESTSTGAWGAEAGGGAEQRPADPSPQQAQQLGDAALRGSGVNDPDPQN